MSDDRAFHSTRRVGWTEVDPSSNYEFTAVLRYVEEAEIAPLRDRGVLARLYPHSPRTFVRAAFRSPARFDDEVTVAIRPSRVGRSSVEFAFEVPGRAAVRRGHAGHGAHRGTTGGRHRCRTTSARP